MPGVEKVVAFVLRVIHPKFFLDIFRQWMNLQREIAAAHGVQKIEPDRKLRSKTSVNCIAQQLSRVRKYKINRGNFHAP